MDFLSTPSKIRPTFFKDVDGKRDMVELRIVGDPNTIILKVKPEHVQEFPREWEAYQAGQEVVQVGGTPLTDVPGIERNMALSLKIQGVRNAEELASLDEGQAKALGMGVLTFSRAAKNLVRMRELEAMAELVQQKDAEKRTRKTIKEDAA